MLSCQTFESYISPHTCCLDRHLYLRSPHRHVVLSDICISNLTTDLLSCQTFVSQISPQTCCLVRHLYLTSHHRQGLTDSHTDIFNIDNIEPARVFYPRLGTIIEYAFQQSSQSIAAVLLLLTCTVK